MKRWRQTIDTYSERIGLILVWASTFLWVILTPGGGFWYVLTGGAEADPQAIHPAVRGPVVAASLFFFAVAAVSFCIPDPTRRATALQRLMFWLAAAGLAFLTVSWVSNGPAEQMWQVVVFWIIGGAMGLLLEPAKAFLHHDPIQTGDEKK